MLNTQVKKKTVKPKSTQRAGQSLQEENSSQVMISKKAYELFEQRGRQNTQDWDDWFKAEEWCRQQNKKTISKK